MKRPEFRERNTERARSLRNNASLAEKRLWPKLSGSKLGGYKFTRQYQIGPYFGDFVCRSAKLVVELDGASHELTYTIDAKRTMFLEQEGYAVIRFTNMDVRDNLEGVLIEIERVLALRPTPGPSRRREGRDEL